jgi:hypothetical protein
MSYAVAVSLFLAALFLGMLLMLEVGRRMGARSLARDPQGGGGFSAIEGAFFALLGLMLAFTFSGAAARFDHRRELTVLEANAIGTAYLRLDLLPADAQPRLRQDLQSYVDARIAFFEALPDRAAATIPLARSAALQRAIWHQAAVAALRAPVPSIAGQLLPALNEMIDITTTRQSAFLRHPPQIIFAMLALLELACATFTGFGMARNQSRSRLHVLGFAAILTLTTYVIVDLEYPRHGLISVSAVDQLLHDVRATMN